MNPDLLIDISGTPAQIAAARLERIAKDVLENAGLSDQAKERAALKVMECDPVEVRREVIRQLPDLLKRLVKDSDLAGAARIRNAQWRLLTADPMLEAAPTADAQVSRFMREISDDMASGWNEAHLVGYCLRELPIETVPYLIEAITKRLTDSQSGMKAVQVSVLERVRIGLNKLHTQIQNVKELIERETNPQRQAHVFLDAFVIGDADLEPEDYEMADLIGKQAANAVTQLLSPDALRALTPLVLARLETLIPEVSVYASNAPAWQKSTLSDIREARLRAELPFDESESAALLHFLERLSTFYLGSEEGIAYMKVFASLTELSGNLIAVLRRIHPGNWEWYSKNNQTQAKALELKSKTSAYPVSPGELWSDAALRDLEGHPQRATWLKLLDHANSSKSKPDGKWEKTALELIREIPDFGASVSAWMSLVGKPRTFMLLEGNQLYDAYNANILRGLLWGVALLEPSDANARGLADVVLTSLKKVPGVGPRSPKIATAGVFALGRMNSLFAVGQLARLKTRVTFKTTLKEIEKALENAATRQGVTKADLEELSVPSCGLESVGAADYDFGDVKAELRVVNSDAVLTWFDANRKVLKNPPSSVKKDFADDLKDLKTNLKDLEQMLAAQSVRLERFVLSRKTWDYGAWRERYLEHPLVGCVTRRLIWTFSHSGDVQNGIWHDGRIVDSSGQALEINPAATVSLWHPMDSSTERVLDWRRFLETRRIVQPWKQAHREIYVLTAAEERTDVYSNRFAAHVLKQHQFAQLAALRGWNNQLRLMVDASYSPPTLELPQWGLRAEFWVEGAGDDYGVDTTEVGTYLSLTTDQVRFYATGSTINYAHGGGGGYEQHIYHNTNPSLPLRLETIPALVLSEVLRDVDLFVGVTSVGNDPAWNDGGPQGRYREYWQSYSFGELSDNALNRKALLETLIPRLKIRDVTSIQGKFLHVKGSLREYKIHMGSGNILMLPNDQYLCIVPGQSVTNASSHVQLPFEGDRTLAVILSKAFMLADDKNIKDVTITRQIRP